MLRLDRRSHVALALLALAASGCTRIVGTGEIDTTEIPVEGFTRLEVSSAFVVNVSFGDAPALTLSVDRAAEDHLIVGVVGDTLRIGLEPRTMLSNVTLEAEVVVPSLQAIAGAGASEIHVADLVSPTLQVELSGASTLDGTVDVDAAEVELSGASSLTVSGRAGQLSGEVSGASELSVPQLAINSLHVDLSGASSAEVNVAESLTADLSGASSLRYRGDPGVVNTDVSGASSVEKLPSS
ncbi:MAG TPA: head GIN domain-containing protein [Acidimicrobiia bacterium]|nr:head GIN domain-containing protein [Acidimicrobiia bacterium]